MTNRVLAGAATRPVRFHGAVSADLIPRLETERTIMRGWRQSDLDAYAAMAADPK
jgi:hypothetical protein